MPEMDFSMPCRHGAPEEECTIRCATCGHECRQHAWEGCHGCILDCREFTDPQPDVNELWRMEG